MFSGLPSGLPLGMVGFIVPTSRWDLLLYTPHPRGTFCLCCPGLLPCSGHILLLQLPQCLWPARTPWWSVTLNPSASCTSCTHLQLRACKDFSQFCRNLPTQCPGFYLGPDPLWRSGLFPDTCLFVCLSILKISSRGFSYVILILNDLFGLHWGFGEIQKLCSHPDSTAQ